MIKGVAKLQCKTGVDSMACLAGDSKLVDYELRPDMLDLVS